MSTYYLNMKWLFSFSLLDLDRFLCFPSGLHCTCFLSLLPWPGWWRIHAHQLSASALARGLAKNSLALRTSLSYYESDSVLSMSVDNDDDDDDDDDDPIGAKSSPKICWPRWICSNFVWCRMVTAMWAAKENEEKPPKVWVVPGRLWRIDVH